MPRRAFFASLCVCFAFLTVPVARPAFTQQTTTVSISSPSAEVGDLLRQGHQLEIERRWGDALAHYEDAMRLFPGESSLERRFEYARLHYDLGCRYTDRSFCETVAKLTPERALDLYSQVLLKIEAHYVEVPNWKELVERGTTNFEVALGDPAFAGRHLPDQDRSAVDAFRRELRGVLGPRVVDSRKRAHDAVAAAAALARQRLKIPCAAVVLEYLCGATNSLDRYSAYLTPERLTDVYAQIEGNFVGLGIELKSRGGGLTIVRVIPGSPAEQSGIRAGDRIVSVDGRTTGQLSTEEAANLLQGEAGSVVELAVVTPGRPPRQLTIRRRRVDVPSIDDVKMLALESGIGYFRLACFQKTTCRDLERALNRLRQEGMQALIIDLRGNPGGLLVAAVEAADKFVPRGIIVSTRGRNVHEDYTYCAHAVDTWQIPLVLLIDQDSASAAEIFAGAVRDHRRGTIVGERSYGKGSVQGIFPLSLSQAGVRLTTAKFYSPTGRPYSRVGVEPDVLVHLAAKPVDGRIVPLDEQDDPTLAAALAAASKLARPR